MKIVLNIATSQDFFIADKDGGISWLPDIDEEIDKGTKFGEFMNQVSIIFMGSATYEQILTLPYGDPWPYAGKTTYVFTSRQHEPKAEVEFVSDPIESVVEKVAKEHPDAIAWLIGGAKLVDSFFATNLVDEVVIAVIPVKLGEGIKLSIPEDKMALTEKKDIGMDIVQLFYSKK